jgi:predicted permease
LLKEPTVSVLWQDLKYGARMLRKKPGFTAIGVLTLALGIGANTAIFSAMDGILHRTLPVQKPERLVLFDDHPSEGTSKGSPFDGVWQLFSFASYRHFAEHLESFDGLAAFRSGETRLSLGEESAAGNGTGQLASGQLVSGSFFPVLGVNAALGRTLMPDDDADTAPAAAVISHGYWKQRLAGDRAALGRVVRINGTSFTIVGVMPETFFGLRVRRSPDFWLPLHFQPQVEQRQSYLTEPDTYWLNMVGRLKPGADLAQAQAEVSVAHVGFLKEQGGVEPSEDYKRAIEHGSVVLAPGARGLSGLRNYYGNALRLLLFVTAFVLVIACANIANLSLSRAMERGPEVSMRLALGASPWRLARQLLTESLLLASLGGAAGLLLALWGVDALKKLVAATAPVDVGVNVPVLAFTALVSVLAGVLFGLAPALRAGRSDLASSMRARGEGGSGRLRPGLAPALVVSQVALSLVLLVGSGLLVRSLRNLANAEVGFEREGVLVVDMDTRIGGLDAKELSGYYTRLLENVEAIPGVRSATVASSSPMSGTNQNSNISIAGYTPAEREDMDVDVMRVGPRYAETLGVRVVEGRDLNERDGAAAAPVGLVNEAFARSFFAGKSPLGMRFGIGDQQTDAVIEIVGVVGDMKRRDLREAPARTVYLPLLREDGQNGFRSDLEIRTSADPTSLVPAVRKAFAEADRRVPIAGVTTLSRQVSNSMRAEQLIARLVGAFGLLALVLACVGLYGILSQAVARRTNEVGIRMALGANRGNVLGMVLREAGILVAVGIAIGIPGALIASRLLTSQLFGVSPFDPLTLAGSALLLSVVAIAAAFVPARRASRIEPMRALRAE